MFIKTLKSLTNYDTTNQKNELKIKTFTGILIRDILRDKHNDMECGIVNFNISKTNGVHTICYLKNEDKYVYFDCFELDALLIFSPLKLFDMALTCSLGI